MQVAETLEALRDAWPNLPGPDDEERLVPPVRRCWVRRVPGTTVAVWYDVGAEGVSVFAVKLQGA